MQYKKYNKPIIISTSSFNRSAYTDDSVIFYTYPTIIYNINEIISIILELEQLTIKYTLDVLIFKILGNTLSKTIKISQKLLYYIQNIETQIKSLTIFANFRKPTKNLPVLQFQIIFFEIFILKNKNMFEIIKPYIPFIENIIIYIACYYKQECIKSIQQKSSANYGIDAYSLKYDVNPEYKMTNYYNQMIGLVNNIIYDLSNDEEEYTSV